MQIRFGSYVHGVTVDEDEIRTRPARDQAFRSMSNILLRPWLLHRTMERDTVGFVEGAMTYR
jgi:hypothetical protein